MNIPMKSTKLINIITHFLTTIFTWNNIFTQITFTVTLPLSIIFTAHTFFPNLLKNPHHTFTFTFTFTHNISDLITSTILLFCVHIWFTYIPTTFDNNNNNININTTLRDITPTKLTLNLILRLILTFIFAYFITLLTVSILSLTDTIVFTIFVIWYAVSNTYLLGTSCLLFIWQLYTIIKSEDLLEAGKAAEALFPKVLSGYLVNVLVTSPLTRTVGEELIPPVWEEMIRRMVRVVFLPTLVFLMVGLKRLFTRELAAAN